MSTCSFSGRKKQKANQAGGGERRPGSEGPKHGYEVTEQVD